MPSAPPVWPELDQAYVTFIDASNVSMGVDDVGYVQGAQVLAASLRSFDESRDVVALVTGHSPDMLALTVALSSVFDRVLPVALVSNPNVLHRVQALLRLPFDDLEQWRADYPDAYQLHLYTKLRVWQLEEYERVLYVDADCMAVRSLQELFDYEPLAAAPDTLPPDSFNSGLMLLQPSRAVWREMKGNFSLLPSHNGGDQGFLNRFFPDWYAQGNRSRLPYAFNAQTKMLSSFKPGWWWRQPDLRLLHFSPDKPWQDPPWGGRRSFHESRKGRFLTLRPLHVQWWDRYGDTPVDDRWQFLFTQHSHLAPLPTSLRVGFHAQTLNRSDGAISGSEVTTRKLERALLAQFGASVQLFTRRYGPEPEQQQRAVDDHLDLLFIEGYHPSLPAFLARLRNSSASLVVVFWCLSVSSQQVHLLDVDAFFTNSQLMMRRLHQMRPTFFMQLAGDPSDCPPPVASPAYSVSYLSGYTRNKEQAGYRLLLGAAEPYGLHVFGNDWGGTLWRHQWRGRWNDSEAALYAQSKVTLGLTVKTQKELGMVNNRIFDALACGTPVVSDHFPALERTVGDLVLYAREPQQTAAAIASVLAWSAEQRAAFRQRAMEWVEAHNFTYAHRVQQILHTYRWLTGRRSAPTT